MSDGSIDVSEMFAVHDAMRKEYGSMPLLVKSIAEGDSDRAAVITEHVHLMGRLMHVHHQGEDELLWPLVQQRAPEHEAVFVMDAEHAELNAELSQIAQLADAWSADPSGANRASLHTALIVFEKRLLKHLGHEERELLPLLASTVTQEEFAALGAYVRDALPADQRTVLLSLIIDDTTPSLRDAMLDAMDPAARSAFEESGRPIARAYRDRLYSMS
ncbi:MAG: hemerythrin domain-containing protein [Actinobacteria bacterium]|nr:hemerythrin domain-containing protein [Actinomycetota bacterium]